MFQHLGNFVSKYWWLTILFWIVLVVVVRLNTPKWDEVTHDGDLAYMPASMPSVIGEELLQKAFPDGRAKSEAVIVLAREAGPITVEDLAVVRSLLSRFQSMFGASLYAQSQRLAKDAEAAQQDNPEQAAALRAKSKAVRERAFSAFDDAVVALEDDTMAAFDKASRSDDANVAIECDYFYAIAAHNLAVMHAEDGNEADAADLRGYAWELRPEYAQQANELVDSSGIVPLVDVWSRFTEVYGSSLSSKDKQADLIFLRLANEFMATENTPFIDKIESTLKQAQSDIPNWPDGLKLGLSGSATVGRDILRSAQESMANTEKYTVILVIGILLFVYRSPALVVVPLVSIVVSLLVATSLVAAITTVDQLPNMEWWNFKIFTTTKIFVVVILFGAGTDYCLFLISRYKEELAAGKSYSVAIADALGGVGEALAASAFTTIVGLGMMFFAQFGKFRNSGPAIGLCLFVTLLACVTLAPALLRALGSTVHFKLRLPGRRADDDQNIKGMDSAWQRTASLIVARPYSVLLSCTLLMLPLAYLGYQHGNDITYDLVSELDDDRISKQGAELLRHHFHVGESGPLVVLAHKPAANFDTAEGIEAIRNLTESMYDVAGVQSVRSLVAPIGGRPQADAKSLIRQNHRITRELYLSKQESLGGDVTRLELVLAHDPFSIESIEVLDRVDAKLKEFQSSASSYWSDSQFAFSGTTAGIRDLREVTSFDNVRIQQLVTLAVLVILLILLRRPAVCIYLIFSVLFSYYVTLGATQLWFEWLYAETYKGLDWKVPLFLFVILVAIGQDYNIYLATRVFEEQKTHGLFGGLRQAIVRTGGIITSCGVIMAGTFLSMMSGSLRGIAELGFALTLGVLLDTFVVRPILVPAFLAILFRVYDARKGRLSPPLPAENVPPAVKTGLMNP